ncbi:MAG: hypothetical protein ACYCSB_01570 [bacterium]|jgi:hypothetical protein
MRKIRLAILGLTVGVLGLGLYGCAKKYNSVSLHTAKYYEKHQKQMAAMIKNCNNIQIKFTTRSQVKKFLKSNTGKECSNAGAAQLVVLARDANKNLSS